MSDSEQLRVCYEGVVRQNPSNVEAVYYLALWHLERHSFQQVTPSLTHSLIFSIASLLHCSLLHMLNSSHTRIAP
jgi:hypothetical protein